jgi:hypothetical protein
VVIVAAVLLSARQSVRPRSTLEART